jgi:hypothetical protein
MKMTIYRHGGTTVVQDNTDKPTLEAMQKMVGGYIQFAPMPKGHKGMLIVVNEDGLGLKLPYNMRASELYRREWLKHHKPKDLNFDMMQLVGDVVVYEGTAEELSEL